MDGAAPGQSAINSLPSSAAGLIVLDAHNRLVYHNSPALNILMYSQNGKKGETLQPVLEYLLEQTGSRKWGLQEFMSGRRRYVCRWFALAHRSGRAEDAAMGIVLERTATTRFDLTVVAQQFGLTQREKQTVELLTLGLTSKEIASRMNISHHTVKAFFRLVMMKMAVNTRSGIVGKIAQFQVAV